MRQNIIINKIVKELIDLEYINACYLGGEFGLKIEDEYSIIDLYCCFITQYEEDFDNIKYKIFENIKNVIFYDKQIDVMNQKNIDYVVFDDEITLRLHHVYLEKDGHIYVDRNNIIIYDPYNVIIQKEKSDYEISNKELGDLVNKIASDALLFSHEYNKNNYPVMISLCSTIYKNYSIYLRANNNITKARLGENGIMKDLEIEERSKYIDLIRNYSFNKLRNFVTLILKNMDKSLETQPIVVAKYFNYDYFKFVLNIFNSYYK
ncbi:MAG: hypothetical protein IJS58_07975 [Bacilli bacterium]|nr:hypothetical protein [Bacilli bacterium]